MNIRNLMLFAIGIVPVALAPGTAWAQGGSIVAWGYNYSGQTNVPAPDTSGQKGAWPTRGVG